MVGFGTLAGVNGQLLFKELAAGYEIFQGRYFAGHFEFAVFRASDQEHTQEINNTQQQQNVNEKAEAKTPTGIVCQILPLSFQLPKE